MRSPRQAEQLVGQAARFVTVGATNTALSFAVYASLVAAGLAAPLAGAMGFAAGALNGYTWNRRWTFRVAGVPWRYVAVQGCGMLATALLLHLLVAHLSADRLVAYALVVPVVTAGTFAASRSWAFAR
jgi:putative flippase GtrA